MPDGHRRTAGHSTQGRFEPAVHQQGRVDALREFTHLADRGPHVVAELREHRLDLVGRFGLGDHLAHEPDRDRQCEQVLLCAVVQVAFDAPTFGVGGSDDAGARTLQLRVGHLQVGKAFFQR